MASPAGGHPPVDPASLGDDFQSDDTRRFNEDSEAQNLLANTKPLSAIKADGFDAVFYPGGHGPLYVLTDNEHSLALLRAFDADQKLIGTVCHGVTALIKATNAANKPIVEGREVTGFTDSEEAAVVATEIVPFSVEQELGKVGATFKCANDWADYSIGDGHIITGQNPGSSDSTARLLLQAMKA